MQQDWKAIWDNLNPDEAAKERMKQAILQKIQAETPQTASKNHRSSYSDVRLEHLPVPLHCAV